MNLVLLWQIVAILLSVSVAILAIMLKRQSRLHTKMIVEMTAQTLRTISRIAKEAEQRVLREKLSARVDQALLSAMISGDSACSATDLIHEMSRRFHNPDERVHERAPHVKLDEMAAGFEDRPPYGENENDRIV